MADSAIRAAGGADAPLTYLVPGAAVIRIKQVHVHYTDNSAGADWLPMVRIVSDSGHTMGQAADQAVKVTAGDDAAVSFLPGVKHAATGGGTSVLDWTWGVRNASMFGHPPFPCPDNVATAHPFPGTLQSFNGAFTWLTVAAANDVLQLNKQGLYAVVGASQWSGSGAYVRALLTNPNAAISLHGDTTANTILDTNPGALGTTWTIDTSLIFIQSPADSTELQLFQQSGGTINVTNASLGAFYFGNT